MHPSAFKSFKKFISIYLKFIENPNIVEIGSFVKNDHNELKSSILRSAVDTKFKYTGLDIVNGPNVDLLLKDPYKISLPDNSVDVVVSISTFEHTEFFWLVYLEILRILKPGGLFFLNVPSNGIYHRQSTDNWRLYQDRIIALEKWGRKNNFNPKVLEHFTTDHKGRDIWCDYVSVTIKDTKFCDKFPNRIVDEINNFRNGRTNRFDKILNYNVLPQDMSHWGWNIYYKLRKILNKINNKYKQQ